MTPAQRSYFAARLRQWAWEERTKGYGEMAKMLEEWALEYDKPTTD